jgi:hypothetical protein
MSVSLGSLFTAATSGKYLLLFSAVVKKNGAWPVKRFVYQRNYTSKNHHQMVHLTLSRDRR